MFLSGAVLMSTILVGIRGEEDKVDVTVYFESVCPDCTDFLRKEFAPYWLALQYNVNLKLVPAGHTHYVDGKLQCQHGNTECALNVMMACALRHFPGLSEVVPFILCLQGGTASMMESCAKPLPIDYAQLTACAEGQEGYRLLEKMHAATNKVRSENFVVPAVMFRGELHMEEDIRFGDEVCKRLSNKTQEDKCNWFVLKRNGQQAISATFAVMTMVIFVGIKGASFLV